MASWSWSEPLDDCNLSLAGAVLGAGAGSASRYFFALARTAIVGCGNWFAMSAFGARLRLRMASAW